MSETWRVVLTDGSVKELTPLLGIQPHTIPPRYRYGRHSYPSIRALIVAIAGDPQHMWDVQEILAPGEPTRAELLATAAGVAERVREAAMEACEAVEDVLDKSRLKEHAKGCSDGVTECENEIRGASRCAAAIRTMDLAAIVGGGK